MDRNVLAELMSSLPWLPEWNNCMSGMYLWHQDPSSEANFQLAKRDLYLGLEKVYVLLECIFKQKRETVKNWQSLVDWRKRLEFYAQLFGLSTLPDTFLKSIHEKDNKFIAEFKSSDPTVFQHWISAP